MANKGIPFEREICKQLSLWMSQGKSDDLFWRTSGSGARATTRAKQGKNTAAHYGDVLAVDQRGQPLMDLVSIELKKGYPGAHLSDALEAKQARTPGENWEGFIEKARIDAYNAGCYWMLIHRRDSREAMVYIPWTLYNHLAFDLEDCRPWMKVITQDELVVFCTSLRSFLKHLDPMTVWASPIRKLAKKLERRIVRR